MALLCSSFVLVNTSYREANVGAFFFFRIARYEISDLCCFSATINLFGTKFNFFRLAQALWHKIKSPELHMLRGLLLQCLAATLDWMCQNRENIKPLQRRKHGTFVITVTPLS